MRMKKVVIVFFCLVSAFTTFIAYEKEAGVSDLVFSEVEALADVELPGVTITCSRDPYDAVGRCYKNIGDTFTKVCRFSGYQSDFCTYSYYVR
ncbi:NVEALA domain-containing protein [Phocaeicola sartorii JCM 17136 = DSM 21941]|nr:hypothetical protein [Phocaeicola sartorii]